MLRAIIIDDEKQLLITLRKDIETFCESVQILAEGDSVRSAVKLINELKPDIVFLDIHLGDGSGFSVLEKVEFKNFRTIFITAYDNYAVKAFRSDAVDYLLKPYSKEELIEAVAKADQFYKSAKLEKLSLQAILVNNSEQKVAISTSEGIELFAVEDILYCQSNGNYCMIHFLNGKKLLSGKTLKEYEAIFQQFGFMRVHHSYLINFRSIKSYQNKDGGYIVMKEGSEIPVSQRRKTYVLSLLEKFLK